MTYKAVATCLFGLEKIVEFELKKAGAKNIAVEDGRVFFEAESGTIARANINSRTSERILLVLGSFFADSFDLLFDGVYSIGWGDIIDREDAFPVKGYSLRSRLTSVPAMQSVIKKAIAERLKKDHNSLFLTERNGVTKRVRFSVIRDNCLIMLDTSGEGLHKRGYRPLRHEAPIRETLAAGIADFARVKPNSAVADPFCGSGTLVIEAAMRAKNIAPGLKRGFAAESYNFFDKKAFGDAREEAKASINKDAAFFARGFDIQASAVENAKRNAEAAGVADSITFEAADARLFTASGNELIITNPPYGERMLTHSESRSLISDFFMRLSGQSFRGLYIINSDPGFEQTVSRTASRRRKLYNGMINCQLFMYY